MSDLFEIELDYITRENADKLVLIYLLPDIFITWHKFERGLRRCCRWLR